jgi:uncharacterized protein
MKISMHAIAQGSFSAMLESMSEWLDKAAAHAAASQQDLVAARLAPDMFTLAQQVQQACYYARDGMARLSGRASAAKPDVATTLAALKAQIAETLELVRAVPATAFDGADERDCSIPIADGKLIAMDGLRFLRAWTLPHFYFHVVTAYGILRHSGVALGKYDYLSEVGDFIRPQPG